MKYFEGWWGPATCEDFLESLVAPANIPLKASGAWPLKNSDRLHDRLKEPIHLG
jgi:hypothetical protein